MKEKEKNFISAVIYVHNCEDQIRAFFDTVAQTFSSEFENGEMIFVNDASTDRSINIIKEASSAFPGISMSILNLDSFHGRETAMQGGAGLSIGDFVLEFDFPYAQITSEDIMAVYSACRDGADIVAAVSDSTVRTSSRLFYKLFNRSADLSYPLVTESFRILSRRAVNRVYSQNNIIAYRKVAYATSGLKAISVRISTGPHTRISGRGRKARRTLAADSFLLFTDVGYKASLILTIAMMVVLIAIAVYAIIVRAMGLPIEGWTSTVLIISFGFFGVFAMLTVIIKYLQLLININVKRKAFTFESIEKLN